ncbi:glutaredoxin family protein [Oceanisphaera pacifica]|uniref:Glutathione S-transferase N-terminal domain-containing protein n=1 Tax=Oceanisphaera pacifica TaxID=2818389 RepID=A0ABS3NJB1_9GAMM|nr:glutathione S-transferase N-terminal domain-containing protein [Oceanisphaera pacifica]MBO1520365.1 glutathione S-transferase N-terminal domain-containing protein [Oceanisphaera pacifica]
MSVFDWFKSGVSESISAPAVASNDKLALYRRDWCPFCDRVQSVLDDLELEINECDTTQPEHLQALVNGGGQRMVPCLRIEPQPGEYVWLYESADIIAYLRRHAEGLK